MTQSEDTLLSRMMAGVGHRFGAHSLSPVGRWLDGTIVAASEDGVTLSYEVRPEMTNPVGTLHGGYAATLLDEVIGTAVMVVSNGRFYATINLAIDFLSPAQVGETVTVQAIINRKGRRLWNVQGEIRGQSGAIVARATSNMIATEQ